ncbi:cystathionine gamma-lyase [Streptomyces violaceorubidus]
MAAVRRWRKVVGAIPGPATQPWLAHRSIATLQLRVYRQDATALRVAEALRARPEITGLRLPRAARRPVPQGRLAADAALRLCRLVHAALRARAERFLDALHLVEGATSFGGVRSTAERRGRWGGDAVPEGFIRLSVGAEDPDDLVADLLRALDETAD